MSPATAIKADCSTGTDSSTPAAVVPIAVEMHETHLTATRTHDQWAVGWRASTELAHTLSAAVSSAALNSASSTVDRIIACINTASRATTSQSERAQKLILNIDEPCVRTIWHLNSPRIDLESRLINVTYYSIAFGKDISHADSIAGGGWTTAIARGRTQENRSTDGE